MRTATLSGLGLFGGYCQLAPPEIWHYLPSVAVGLNAAWLYMRCSAPCYNHPIWSLYEVPYQNHPVWSLRYLIIFSHPLLAESTPLNVFHKALFQVTLVSGLCSSKIWTLIYFCAWMRFASDFWRLLTQYLTVLVGKIAISVQWLSLHGRLWVSPIPSV